MRTRAQLKVEELRRAGVLALTERQMAAALQISVFSLQGMMERGEIAFYRIGKRIVRFPIGEAVRQMEATVLVRAKGGEGNSHAKTRRREEHRAGLGPLTINNQPSAINQLLDHEIHQIPER